MTRRRIAPSSEPYTDLGNARRFVAQHGHRVRYCNPWGKWLVWDGIRWVIDDTGEVDRLAKQTVRDMYDSISAIGDTGTREKFARHAAKSEYEGRIRAMISLATTEKGIPIKPEDLDKQPLLLNCRNGTLDLRTGTLLPHRQDDLITKLAPVDFDPAATCPIFDKFITQILGGDRLLVDYMQRCAGYALTGDVSEQVMFVLFGSGANGKTTLLEALRYVLGDYGGQVPVQTLLAKKFEDNTSNGVAQMQGLRFVTSSEVEAGQRLAEAQVKRLVGGGRLHARYLYREPFEFEPSHKVLMDCNHKPEIRGTENAIWRRMKVIPFTVSIPEDARDKHLLEKLKAESSGILAWAVRGCLDWQRGGLAEPPCVNAATGKYREEMDLAKQFIQEECTLDPAGQETVDRLYGAFAAWCRGQGDEPLTKKAFGSVLGDVAGLTQGKLKGSRCWNGISLTPLQPRQRAA